MKTSHILFATASAVPFFTLVGLSGVGAFSIMTALSIVAMLSLDYDNSRRASYEVATRPSAAAGSPPVVRLFAVPRRAILTPRRSDLAVGLISSLNRVGRREARESIPLVSDITSQRDFSFHSLGGIPGG